MSRRPITAANPYTPRSGPLAGHTFTSERQYRNALARLNGFSSWDAQRRARQSTPLSTGTASSPASPASEEGTDV